MLEIEFVPVGIANDDESAFPPVPHMQTSASNAEQGGIHHIAIAGQDTHSWNRLCHTVPKL
jgi:hypothetical protein